MNTKFNSMGFASFESLRSCILYNQLKQKAQIQNKKKRKNLLKMVKLNKMEIQRKFF